jgi:hypothetical protein
VEGDQRVSEGIVGNPDNESPGATCDSLNFLFARYSSARAFLSANDESNVSEELIVLLQFKSDISLAGSQ